jgi:hypothetical protein
MNGRVWGRRARRGGDNELLEGAPFLSRVVEAADHEVGYTDTSAARMAPHG